jgi:hypothetical protein
MRIGLLYKRGVDLRGMHCFTCGGDTPSTAGTHAIVAGQIAQPEYFARTDGAAYLAVGNSFAGADDHED